MHWSPILVDHDDATGLHSTIHKLEDIECYTRPNVIISHCNCYIAQLALVVIGYYCSISNFQKICVIHVEGLNLNKCHNSEDLSADLRRSYWHTLLNLNSSRHAPCRPFIGVKWSLEITLSPLFEFTDQFQPRFFDRVTRLGSWDELSLWKYPHHWQYGLGKPHHHVSKDMIRALVGSSPFFANWSFFPKLENMTKWTVGGYIFWIQPMLKAVRGLLSCM